MLTIYKYPLALADIQAIEMPQGARILSVHEQRGVITLWALVDPAAALPTLVWREVRIHGTGHPVEDEVGRSWFFVGTVLQFNGGLVWHVFIGPEPSA